MNISPKHGKQVNFASNYIAPEILINEGNNSLLNFYCDYWSLGIILFECVIGYPPFYCYNEIKTLQKIINFKNKKQIIIPKQAAISKECADLIINLLRFEPKKRISFKNIKRHLFFKGIKWDNLKSVKPPWIPKIHKDDDIRYVFIK